MSKACDSQLSPSWSAALIPPWAALECERTGWTLETIPTETPSSAAASAARWPGEPGSDHQYVVLRHARAILYRSRAGPARSVEPAGRAGPAVV